MNKFIKLIVLAVALSFQGNNSYCQNYFNNLYNHSGFNEFDRELHILSNGNIVACGSINDRTSVGQIVRTISKSGDLIWEKLTVDATHNLYSNWNHTSTIVDDSLLIITSTAEILNGDFQQFKPYFLKYNLNNQILERIKFFNFSEFNISVYSATLHTDGYIYSAGVEYIDSESLPSDILIMKLDTDGNLVWKKNIDKAEVEIVNEIDSFGENLLISGYSNYNTSTTFLAMVDTSAAVKEFVYSVPFGKSGGINVETKNNFIYYSSMSAIELANNETLYLAKFNKNFEIVWDTLVPNTSQYYIRTRRMEIVNDQMVILSDIADALDYTNDRVWSHAAAWSLEGEFQWEHVYFQDSAAIHHLDDVEMLANGDLVFMGTVFNTEGQHLWLFTTDSQGCGTVQDTCYYTLDKYFGLDTITSISEPSYFQSSPLQILGNPFNEQLLLQTNNNQSFDVVIYNVKGQLVYEGLLSGTLHLNTSNWQSGIYVLQLMDNGQLVGVEKLLWE